MIGYAMCGSFCTHKASLEQLNMLVSHGYDVQPIMSEIVYSTDTRFGKAAELARQAVNTRVLSCRIQWQQQEFPHLATLNLDFGHCCWLPTAKPSLLDSSVGVFSFLAGSRLLYVRFSSYG